MAGEGLIGLLVGAGIATAVALGLAALSTKPCPKCHRGVQNNASWCPYCGTKL